MSRHVTQWTPQGKTSADCSYKKSPTKYIVFVGIMQLESEITTFLPANHLAMQAPVAMQSPLYGGICSVVRF